MFSTKKKDNDAESSALDQPLLATGFSDSPSAFDDGHEGNSTSSSTNSIMRAPVASSAHVGLVGTPTRPGYVRVTPMDDDENDGIDPEGQAARANLIAMRRQQGELLALMLG